MLREVEAFELLLAQVSIFEGKAIRHRFSNGSRDANTARWGELLKSLREHHGSAGYGTVRGHDFSQSNSDPQFRADFIALHGEMGAIVGLKIQCDTGSVRCARKLCDQGITSEFVNDSTGSFDQDGEAAKNILNSLVGNFLVPLNERG